MKCYRLSNLFRKVLFLLCFFLFEHTYAQNIEELNRKELRAYIQSIQSTIDSSNRVIESLRAFKSDCERNAMVLENELHSKEDDLKMKIKELKTAESEFLSEQDRTLGIVGRINELNADSERIQKELAYHKNLVDSLNAKHANSSVIVKSDDSADSNSERQVKIGKQIWMSENLNVDTFRNGDPIAQVTSDAEWKNATLKGKPAWCYLYNDSEMGEIYGKLYNWFAVNDPRGLAPEGWHVASDSEWKAMVAGLGGGKSASSKLKSKTGWDENRYGTNASGFAALPGGSRIWDGTFTEPGEYGSWWTSTAVSDENAKFRQLISYTDETMTSLMKICYDYGYVVECEPDLKSLFLENAKQTRANPKATLENDIRSVSIRDCNKGGGFSVRCIKD